MRLVGWCVAFVAGDACALADVLGWRSGLAAALIAVASIAVARGRRASVAVAAALFALGVLLGTRAVRPPAAHPALAAALDSDAAQAIEGTVIRGPESTGTGARLTVALTRVGGVPAAGTLALSVAGGWPDFGPGERDRLPGAPARAAGNAQPRPARSGAGPARRRRRRAGRRCRGRRDRARRRAGPAPARGGSRFLPGARCGPRSTARFTETRRAFLKTAVLGDRRGVGPDVEEGFRAAGATHVLSVSGLHLAAVATLLFLVVGSAAARVPRLPLYVDPRAVAAAVALPAIAFFALVTGEAIATVRSALMLSIGMGAYPGRAARRRPARRSPPRRWSLLGGEPAASCAISRCSCRWPRSSASRWARAASGPGAAAPAACARGALLAWLWRFGAATIAGDGGDRAARARITSARSRRCRRSEIWRWCRSSSWRSCPSVSRARRPGAIWPPLGTAAARGGRAGRARGPGDGGRFPRARAGVAVPRRRTGSRRRR